MSRPGVDWPILTSIDPVPVRLAQRVTAYSIQYRIGTTSGSFGGLVTVPENTTLASLCDKINREVREAIEAKEKGAAG